MKEEFTIQALYPKLISRTLSIAEAKWLEVYFGVGEQLELLQLIRAELELSVSDAQPNAQEQATLNRVYNSIAKERSMQTPVYKLFKIKLLQRIAIAASLVIMTSIGFYFYNHKLAKEVTYANDVAPGKNGATLTLTNGQKISINDALTGNITEQAGVKISKTADGQIVYEVINSSIQNAERQTPSAYNTLSTSRGQQSQVRLPDGTLVFLNAESSLRYPTSFASLKERRVELTGEAYFEVAKAWSKESNTAASLRGTKQSPSRVPFFVKTATQQVEVLGTHFNVNAYADEPVMKTTLLEGSVRIASLRARYEARQSPSLSLSGTSETRRDLSYVILKPGEQAMQALGSLKVAEVDTQLAMAWKNNEFLFENESIENIMRMVARWYDVEVIYEGKKSKEKFGGGVSRFDKVSKVLQLLERTGAVRFRVEGRKIYVL